MLFPNSTYYKARTTPQSITTALGHERTPRKLDATRCDDATSSGAAGVSNLESTTLESLSSLSLQGAETKYHSLQSEGSFAANFWHHLQMKAT
jgi:hypothetical protein